MKVNSAIKIRTGSIYAFAIIALLFFGTEAFAVGKVVKVGFSIIPGISFLDANGNRAGYYYELMERVATKMAWTLEYRDAPWNECLSLLSSSEIDLLSFTGKAHGKDKLFDFNRETVITTWSTVLIRKEMPYKEIDDLQAHAIAMVRGSDESGGFIELMQSSSITVIPVYCDDVEQLTKLFRAGKADALVIPSNMAAILLKTGKYRETGIVFNGESRGFAVRKGQNGDLIEGIDESLRNIKLSEPEFLSKLKAKYISPPVEYNIPPWLTILVISLFAASLLGMVFVIILRYQVKKHTGQLQIQMKRLQEKTLEAEKANKELEAFSYSVSHDLRAPLRALEGYSALLTEKEGALDEEGKHYLARVKDSTKRMQSLIEDLLHLSRMTLQELKRREVDLSALAGEILADLRERESGDRAVATEIAPGLVADCDRELMRIALENLLNNAWKFTRKNADARIEFGANRTAGSCEYYVRDNGVGFDMAYAGKLFSPFQRLHSEHDFPGTGIGLATVKRVIERHGGRVWIESAQNRGTTVFFTLDTLIDSFRD